MFQIMNIYLLRHKWFAFLLFFNRDNSEANNSVHLTFCPGKQFHSVAIL